MAACSSLPDKRAQRGPSPAVPNPHAKVGGAYQVNGVWYVPKAEPNYDRVGFASWYGPGFHGRLTANGEVFDEDRLTAAHPTLPLPSIVEVTNPKNGKRLKLRVNDRGPFANNRILDLSKEAAKQLGTLNEGVATVRVRYVGPARLERMNDGRALVVVPVFDEVDSLEELYQADLLIHLVDISADRFEDRMATVNQILRELELGESEGLFTTIALVTFLTMLLTPVVADAVTGPDGTELGPSITDAVARLTDTHPEQVGSHLRGSVDPDGLERVFHPPADGATREGGRLVIPVESCVVTVESDGWVSVVHRPDDG